MSDLHLYSITDDGNEINLSFASDNISIDNEVVIIDANVEIEDVDIHTNMQEESLNADFGIITERIIQGDTQIYKGEYEVTPKVSKQYLETAQKYLTKNVTVNEIPLYETDNQKGTTIYIGNKVI